MLLCWRKYQDFKNRISLDLPVFSTSDCENEDAFYEKHNDIIMDMMMACVELAINSSFESVPCFIIDGETLEIKKEFYMEKLKLCEDYFVGKEQYEKCSKIIELRKALENPVKKRKIEIE